METYQLVRIFQPYLFHGVIIVHTQAGSQENYFS